MVAEDRIQGVAEAKPRQSREKSRCIGIGCGLNNWNSLVDGIGIVIIKIKYLLNEEYCILEMEKIIEKRDVERCWSSLLDLKSRKVSGSNIGCHKLASCSKLAKE